MGTRRAFSCVIMRRILPLWTCSLSRRSVSTCSMPSSSSGSIAETSSGSTSQQTRQRNGLRQIMEAFPWDDALKYLIRDQDQIYGIVVTRRLRAMGLRDKPTAPASPWQNGFGERLIGSIRRECVDHIIVLGICARYCNRTCAITMTSGRTGHWTKMRRSLAKFSESEISIT